MNLFLGWTKQERLHLAVVVGIYFISRLIFWPKNFGMDPDSWRIAMSARDLAELGQYNVSRFPGYPVPELFSALLMKIHPALPLPWVFFLGAATCVIFFLTLREEKIQGALWWTLALMAVPNFYINNLSLMDFGYSFFFYVVSFFLLIRGNWKSSAVLLGLAIASRITYGAMLIPYILYLWKNESWNTNLRQKILCYIGICLAAGLIFFSPVLFRYGIGFLKFYPGAFSLVVLGWKLTVGFWGLLGTFAVLCFGGHFIWLHKRHELDFKNHMIFPTAVCFILYLIAFVKLPEDSSYLLPLLPWFFICLAMTKITKWVQAGLFFLFLSPFIGYVYKDGFQIKGPLLVDSAQRTELNTKIAEVSEKIKAIDLKTTIILAGYFDSALEYQLVYQDRVATKEQVQAALRHTITEDQWHDFIKNGKKIFFVSGAETYQAQTTGLSVETMNAAPL